MNITANSSLKVYNFEIKKTNILWNDYDNTLFVDPGFNTGMVYCSPQSNKTIKLEVSTIKSISTLYTIEYRYEKLLSIFSKYAKDKNIFTIICEDIFMRPDSERSLQAALSQSLFKTSNIIGMYRAIALCEGFNFKTIHAHEWRGQMNDKIVKSRIEKKLYPLIIDIRKFDKTVLNSHVCSALGMMLHHVNLLNKE